MSHVEAGRPCLSALTAPPSDSLPSPFSTPPPRDYSRLIPSAPPRPSRASFRVWRALHRPKAQRCGVGSSDAGHTFFCSVLVKSRVPFFVRGNSLGLAPFFLLLLLLPLLACLLMFVSWKNLGFLVFQICWNAFHTIFFRACAVGLVLGVWCIFFCLLLFSVFCVCFFFFQRPPCRLLL